MAAVGVSRLFLVSILLFSFLGTSFCAHGPSLKDINNSTFMVTASATNVSYYKTGMDNITVTWRTNAGGDTSTWKTVSLKLCYAPVSQKDRAWRKTLDPISKDKTCQFKITSKPYTAGEQSFTWVITRNVPTASYFVRGYVMDAAGIEVAYGQTTNAKKETDIFMVEAISGRHVSLDIASVTFSAFSVISLAGFFWLEKSRAKSAANK